MPPPVSSEWTTICRVYGNAEAVIVIAKLQSAGIGVVPLCRHTVSVAWHWTNAVGGIEIMVPTTQATAALEILSECELQPLRKQSFVGALVMIAVFFLAGLPPPASGFFVARAATTKERSFG